MPKLTKTFFRLKLKILSGYFSLSANLEKKIETLNKGRGGIRIRAVDKDKENSKLCLYLYIPCSNTNGSRT